MNHLLTTSAGVAASARVGNLIGARSVRGSKRAGHAAALLSVVVGAIVMISMMATKDVRIVDVYDEVLTEL